MPTGWGLRGGTELRTISRALREEGDVGLKVRLRTELRAVASPLVPAVRASAMAIPSKQTHARREGLRAAIAKAVTLRVRTVGKMASVAIFVDGRKMPDRAGKLPQYMEGTARPWRHPVFGNTAVWAQQPAHPYFYKVVVPAGFASRLAINRVLDDVTRHITGRHV